MSALLAFAVGFARGLVDYRPAPTPRRRPPRRPRKVDEAAPVAVPSSPPVPFGRGVCSECAAVTRLYSVPGGPRCRECLEAP